jgi:hypothetical protein
VHYLNGLSTFGSLAFDGASLKRLSGKFVNIFALFHLEHLSILGDEFELILG